MPPIQGYTASVEAARQALEAAQTALPRDVSQAVMAAGWKFLRDRHDVNALIDHITLAAEDAGWRRAFDSGSSRRSGRWCTACRYP